MADAGLPPLVALRAFEATARHLSATKAAAELHVTLGAVSHQLRALEAFLGADLFVRGHRQLSLTPRGARYFDAVSAAFERLRVATRAMQQPGRPARIQVRAYTTFALRWLIPRLSDFYARQRSVELSLSVSHDPVDFNRDDLDFAIRLGVPGDWPGAKVERLLPNRMAPVCSPALLAAGAPVHKPADLRRHVLLQCTARERRQDWADWFATQGVSTVRAKSQLHFESSALAYQAAIEGHGLAMAQLALVRQDIEAGRLVCPLAEVLDRGAYTYYLIHPVLGQLDGPREAFRSWLMEACAADATQQARVSRRSRRATPAPAT